MPKPRGGKPPTAGNQEPEIFAQSFTVDENSLVGEVVGTVVATDPNGDALTYSIISGNEDGAFIIDPATGVITVADGSLLDHESLAERELVVQVGDKKTTTSATMTIAIADVNEAPTAIALDSASVDESVAGAVIGIRLAVGKIRNLPFTRAWNGPSRPAIKGYRHEAEGPASPENKWNRECRDNCWF